MRALQLGQLAEAEELADTAMALGSESVPESMTAFGAQLIEILRVAGRWDELAQMGELMAAAAAENPAVPALRAVLARTYCDLSRDDDALATLHDDIGDGFNGFPYDVVWLSGMVVLAETCIRLGQWEACKLLYEKLSPWRDQAATVTATCVGPVALHLATLSTVLGRYDDAEELFSLALALSERLAAPYWRARTEVELAAMMRRRSDSVDRRSEELLEHATLLANDQGFGGLLPRIAEVGPHGPVEHFRDEVSVVTGAASGIGRQLALDFVARGAKVYGVDVQSTALREVPGITPMSCGPRRCIDLFVALLKVWSAKTVASTFWPMWRSTTGRCGRRGMISTSTDHPPGDLPGTTFGNARCTARHRRTSAWLRPGTCLPTRSAPRSPAPRPTSHQREPWRALARAPH